ncbi:ATP-binding protein [Streptomyces antibioticus]|uniref:ATP-binding protein n=1 Tax=Streptomyces antibioticus TaxID=1890 RepID=UPI0022525473|nr:ATP-binding protein [Streptomyces antibioticus]MCX4740737.1 ATP-binding protein [Streptomyces antibioticus]MCX4740745.1 ATP-binding protein [Streptomyces antibioticus]
MTTHIVGQERTRRRAPGTADELISRTGALPALEVCIERRPDPDRGGLSTADAAWPKRLRRIVRASLNRWGRPELIEDTELLLTELATNALRHGSGRSICVRVSAQDDTLKIQVTDGSPTRPELRHAALDDEGGRGLLLVESLAEEWGVSDDGTTTWCTLPLTEGPEEMQPAAATTPVFREIRLELPADPSAAGSARIQARTMLTMAAWPGNQRHAIDVLHTLVENAVQHALAPGKADQPFGACLRFTETDELLIDVTDPVPHFPDFDQAVAGESGGGLWEIAQEGVELSWFVASSEFDAKTVRAVVRPGPVDL